MIAPSVNFAQVLVYPPNQKVGIEVAVSPAICADFNLSPVLHVPMQVIVWRPPEAVDTTLFGVPCEYHGQAAMSAQSKADPTPTPPVNANPPPAAVN